jgi:hypothetical protein
MDTTHILHLWLLDLGGYVIWSLSHFIDISLWLFISIVPCFHPRFLCSTLRCALPPPLCSHFLLFVFPVPLIWQGGAPPAEAMVAPRVDPKPYQASAWWTWWKAQLTPILLSPLSKFKQRWT